MEEEVKAKTVGELICYYRDRYPDGQGDRQLTLEETAQVTKVPRATVSRWCRDEVDWGPSINALALCIGLGIPREEWDAAVLGVPYVPPEPEEVDSDE